MLRLTKDETWSILFREWKKGTENILTARHFKVRCFKSSAQLTAKLLNLRPCTIRASPSSRLGPGSSVGIATELRAGRSGDRVPVGARFSAPVQTGPGAHPASCTMGTGSFPGVKSGRGVTLSPHPLIVSWSRKSRAIPLLPLWAVRLVQGCTLPSFYLHLHQCFSTAGPWYQLYRAARGPSGICHFSFLSNFHE